MNKKQEQLCNEHPCCDVCDFCVYYNYNGEDMLNTDGEVMAKGAIYVYKGYCEHSKKKQTDPGDPICKYFKCEICGSKKKK